MEYSKLTTELRKKLDAAGVEWTDNSDFYVDNHYIRSIERTAVDDVRTKDPDYPAHQFSIIYGFIQIPDSGTKVSVTYGYPEMLECWCPEFYPEPVPLSVDKIMELIDKFIVKEQSYDD